MGTIESTVEAPKAGFLYARRRWFLSALLVIAFSGLAVAHIARPDSPILITHGVGEISRIDPRTGATAYTVTNAVKAPNSSSIYRAEEIGDSTVIEVLDPGSGEVISSTTVGGRLEIRAVSPLGGAVALMTHRQSSADLYIPEPREYTSINVVWSESGPPRNYTLKGNFEPETFSIDEQTLFLLEFFPPTAPDRYYVKQLDLQTASVTNVLTSDQDQGIELNPEMRGHARAQVMAPDGSFLFSLYTIEAGEAPVHDPAAPHSDRWAFVHTLNLEEKWSHCIFLPLPFGTAAESAMSLGMSEDGKDLFLIDAATEHVARIDGRSFDIERVEKIPGLRSTTARPVAVGPEVIYIGLGDSVLEMGRESLIPSAAFVVNTGSGSLPVLSLELAPDGRTLRVAHGSSISVLDMPSERVIATLTSPGRTDGSFVGAPVGERTQLSLEWVIPGS
jgi:hypothetical protein